MSDNDGTAIFTDDGNVKIFDSSGQQVCSGTISGNNSRMFELVVALMKHHGDWPIDPPCDRMVDLKNLI